MKTLKFLTTIILSIGIFFSNNSCSHSLEKENSDKEQDQCKFDDLGRYIPFEVEDNRIVVRAKLNDLIYANLLVDNGCHELILSKVFLDKYKDTLNLVHYANVLPTDYFSAYPNLKRSIAKGVLAYYFGDSVFKNKNTSAYSIGNEMIDQFSIIIEAEKYDMFHWPLPEGVDGIIPLSNFASRGIVKINFEKQRIEFYDKVDSSAKSYPYELKNKLQIIQIPLSLRTKKNQQKQFLLSTLIDLGFSGNVELFKTPKVSKVIPKIKNYTQNVEYNYSPTKITPLFFKEIFFDNTLVFNARFLYREERTNGYDVMIGNAFLKNFDLYFDYSNKKIYMQPYHSSFSDVKDTSSILSGVIFNIDQKGNCKENYCDFTYKYTVFGTISEQIKTDFRLNDEVLKFGNLSSVKLSRDGFLKLKDSTFKEVTIKRGNDTIILHITK